jgi:hypothetical protein
MDDIAETAMMFVTQAAKYSDRAALGAVGERRSVETVGASLLSGVQINSRSTLWVGPARCGRTPAQRVNLKTAKASTCLCFSSSVPTR